MRTDLDPGVKLYYTDDYAELCNAALETARSRQMTLVAFDSLYMIGNIRPFLRQALADKQA